MSGIWDAIDRVERLLQSSSSRRGQARSHGIDPDFTKFSFRPNPPKMVTIFLAIALILVGLSVSETVSIGFVNDLLSGLDWAPSQSQGYLMLVGSPVLLIIGSLLPGV